MDPSIPIGLPQHIVEELQELNNEFSEGYLTEKGYIKKKRLILSKYGTPNTQVSTPDHPNHHNRAYSVNSGLTGISLDSSKANALSRQESTPPTSGTELQKPLDPRVLSSEPNGPESFDTLGTILRHRSSTYPKEQAIIVVDSKGKETVTISWEKLYLKAEKVAQQIKDKSGLYKNDRVCLIYQNVEVIDYTIALFGCFLAGVVAVPITLDLRLNEIIQIMNQTQSHLCLTSKQVAEYLDKKVTATSKIKWPKGLEFWKTTDFGTYHPQKKQDPPALQVPDLAYIEFVKSPDGELRGVAISHKTIMQQMNSLTNIFSSNPNYNGKPYKRSDISFTRTRNVMLNILDARKSVGLIVGTLLNVFSGNLMIWTPSSLLDIAGLYANIITRFGVTILLNDYLNLKQVVYNYQSFPQYTRKFSKKEVDFSTLKWCLIYSSIVDGEFHEILTNRWLKPLGCKNVDNVVAPLLTLSEFGGMVISMRDWLGEEHKLNATLNQSLIDDGDSMARSVSNLSEVLIDKNYLTTNTVKVVSDRPPPIAESFRSSGLIRIGSFGFPLPDATLAIVNPDTCYLSGVMEVGEICIDSVSLPGGFWGLPTGTENIFHARCRDHEGFLDLEFLRTGLLGFTYNGKVYVLGLYEDRLRQRVTWIDNKTIKSDDIQYKYHYSDHLAYTLARAIPQRRVSDSSAFDILINNEYLPVVVIESAFAVPSESGIVDIPEVDMIASKSFVVLERYHNVRPYCVLILPPDTLPRTIKSGIPGIANMLCKRQFVEGTLASVYIKYNIKRSITEVPRSKFYLDSIWSKIVSDQRHLSLHDMEDQYSGLDFRDTSIDDRTKKPLTDFDSLLEILQWRVKHQPDELAFSTVSRGTAAKQSSWKKFDNRVAGVVSLILDKVKKHKMRVGDHIILMFTLSEDFVTAVYACLITGMIPIPLNPVDVNRLNEDIPILVSIIRDYKVKTIFVNSDVETILKNKPVSPLLKESNAYQTIKLRNTSKAKTSASLSNLQSRVDTIYKVKSVVEDNSTVLIWLNFTEDGRRIAVKLSHKTISSICKIMKETCQLESKNPVISCVRNTSGIGFIQSALIGVYLGSATYIIPPLDFATNPSLFFLTLARYKVKDVYVTPQMMEYALRRVKSKDFVLDRVKNLMIGYDGRPDVNLIKNVAVQFSPTKLSSSAISHIYSHNFNPMITSRSYLAFDAIDLWIDPDALRLGLISIVNPSNNPNAIHLQDSGIVPVCTQIAIVNPETRRLCKVGEYGEIWVCSEGNIEGTLSKLNNKSGESFEKYQFNAKIEGGDHSLNYIRTGDLGFLHNVSRFDQSTAIDFQPLFVLGQIADTFESMGLSHFASDVEKSIERSHPDIRSGGSCVFKAGGFVIAVIDSSRGRFLSSLVPVIFNKVLSTHYLVIDIVIFTKPKGFPYSRLGVKQRKRVVDHFVSKKLPIQAQYGLNQGEPSLIKMVQDFENISEVSSLHTKVEDRPMSFQSSQLEVQKLDNLT
ncbi:Disco-interacting protein 2 C [Wickerhamomyces ciferrii]|uniref:Disco-interacting protein 2 C n=1 Tax=Wickerhamomyces ciferrii (strain ATCC 14091 / BCRC 22168 / CBS 111 / JCM 3599 / NBRC 0793 / NRRL Y-1031 F-60-10) TaxID=1206466 RepID=K0KL26_WICCF|nr:Disco-interacting protein 2 C [Wickerhamomyces ciferrii]CCH41793.1 Disco-interacting protein 2 C [Wickerhamomyces ciferrii]